MRRTTRIGVILGLAIVALPAIARARSIAIVPLIASGSVDDEDLFQVGETVSTTLRERGHDVLGPVEAAELIDERVPGCIASRQPACWLQAANRVGRDTIVHGRVQREGTTGHAAVSLTALDARSGRVLVEATHQGVAATRADLEGLAHTAAEHLSDELPILQRHPRLRVQTQPTGADLAVNGNPVGRTPWSAEVAEGRSVVEARMPGHRRAVREITLAEGQNRSITLLLQVGQDADRGDGGRSERASWQLPIGIAGLAVGALGVGVGMFQLLRDECLETYADGPCRRQMTTGERVGLGVVPLTLGLAVATAGALVGFAFDLGVRDDRPR
jgi:hypothetical protein